MDPRIVFAFLLTFAASAYSQTPNKLDVSVYYESLCPDSMAFVTNQLEPTWKKLSKFLTVTLVPFGKSTFTRDETAHSIQFQCHHGPEECEGNKVHACAIDVLKSDDERVKMVACLMSTPHIDNKTKVLNYAQCATDLKLDVEALKECVINTTKSDELLYQQGVKTQNFQKPLKSVPTVVFRSQYNKDTQDKATKDLSKTVCTELGGPSKVMECNGGSARKPVLVLLGLSMLLALFMGRQM